MTSTTPSSNSDSRNELLEQVLADYLRAQESGEPVDPQKFIAAHPDLAAELRAFFQNHAVVDQLAAPLREVLSPADTPTLDQSGSSRVAEVGARLKYFGDYELLGEIARGGMGVVFRAKQTSLGRIVALKMIIAGNLAAPDDIRRFKQEAEAAANLDHPHIVPIYEVGEHDGQHYFSMRLMEGGSLGDALRSGQKFSLATAAKLIATIARAVHHAHQRSVLHRDLKPGNILLDTAGEPHVSDFGLAKQVDGDDQLTRTGAVVGTPNYMAPEQAMAQKQLSTAVDVFSLGAIFYELLTGKPPFQAISPMETLLQVMSKEAVSPRSANQLVDVDLETICLKCLEKEPQRRYDSAAAFADDLERWLRHEPIVARRISFMQRATKWARRHPALAALGSVIVLAATVFLVLLAVSNQQIRESEGRTTEALEKSVAAGKLAERRLYASQMLLASAAINERQIGQAREALDAAAPVYRGWEWDYLRASVDQSVQTVHQDPGGRMAFSADGNRVALLGDFRGLAIFELAAPEKRELQNIDTGWTESQSHRYGNVALTKDLRHAAVYRPDGLYWWTAGEKQAQPWGPRRTKTDGRLEPFAGGVQLSRDEQLLYAVGENKLTCWDVGAATEVWSMPLDTNEVYAIHLSPDESLLAVAADDNAVQVIDLAKRERIFRSSAQVNRVTGVHFTADSKNLFSACAFQRPRLWRLSDGEQLLKPTSRWGVAFDFSADGKLGAYGSFYGEVCIFDPQTGKELRVLREPENKVHALAFSPAGDLIATAGTDKLIRLHDPNTGELKRILSGHHSFIFSLAFSPDGQTLASVDFDDDFKFWDLRQPARPWRVPQESGDFAHLHVLRDERTLLCGGQRYDSQTKQSAGRVNCFDLSTGKLRQQIGPHGKRIKGLAVTPDEQLLATVADDGQVRLWNLADGSPAGAFGELPELPGEKVGGYYDVTHVAIHAGGQQLTIARSYGRLECWNLQTKTRVWQQRLTTEKMLAGEPLPDPLDPAQRVAYRNCEHLQYTADGKHLVCQIGSSDPFVQVYDAATGTRLFSSERLRYPAAHAVSGDGHWLAYGSVAVFNRDGEPPQKIVIRDLWANTEATRIATDGNATALAFHPQGRQLAVGWHQMRVDIGEDQLTRFSPAFSGIDLVSWQTSFSNQPQRQTIQRQRRTITALSYLPDGSRLISGDGDQAARWWGTDGLLLLSQMLPQSPHRQVKRIIVSPRGEHVIGSDGDFEAVVWSKSILTVNPALAK